VTYIATGLSTGQFLVIYSTNSYSSQAGVGNIRSVFITSNPADWKDLVITDISDLQIATSVGFLRADQVDQTSAVVAFIDLNLNYGLRCVMVNILHDANGEKRIAYGASYTFSVGYTIAQDPFGLFMDFDIETFHMTRNTTGIMVLFSDSSNNGKMTVATAMV